MFWIRCRRVVQDEHGRGNQEGTGEMIIPRRLISQVSRIYIPFIRWSVQGWDVQRWVKFYPGLSKTYSSHCFSKEKITVLIKYCSDFRRKNLIIPNLQVNFISVRLETKPWVINLTLG